MKVNRFEDLVVWRKSREFAFAVYKSSASGDFARDFALRDQLRRSAVSVMSNIAEGFGRFTGPEIRRFLSIARGSLAEAKSQLYLARDLGYLTERDHHALNARCVEIDRMLAALRSSLNPPPRNPQPKASRLST